MDSPARLRIAFVADTINGRIGGGVTSARHMVEKLRENHEVLEVGADADGPGKLPSFTVPFTVQREMDFVMALPDRRKLERLFGGVDIVHVQFPFLLARSAVRAAGRVERPVVAAFHVQPENAFLNVGVHSRRLNDWLYRAWARGIYNRADAVVAPTAFAERKLREHGVTAPVRVISNGIPPDLARDPPPGVHRRDGPFVVMTAGRLAAEKRQDLLIEALRRCRHQAEIKLVIAGAGPRLASLQRLSKGLSNPAEIGFVSRERLLELLHRSDLFVHCSEVELEGIAPIEAMSAGLPVLVAQASESAASELALDDDFRFPAGDAAALAERIDHLFEHPEILEAARPRYRAAALKLDFGESVQKLVDLYRSVIAARLRSGNPPRGGV